MPLLPGLTEIVSNPKVVLQQILHWTCGQPFLTQKLCKLVLSACQQGGEKVLRIPCDGEAFWVEKLVRSHIIENWEANDEPEHLKTIRDRILRREQRAGRLLGLYQQILAPLTPQLWGEQDLTPPRFGGLGGQMRKSCRQLHPSKHP